MKENRGQALVEFVVILPTMLLVIMAMFDLGNIFYKKYSLENELDYIVELYDSKKFYEINNYASSKEFSVNYEKSNMTKIILKKKVKIATPFLNNILGKEYDVEVERSVYEK